MTTHLTVTRTEDLSPRLRRLWFSSDDLSAFAESGQTDRYVKLIFPRPGVDYPHLDVKQLRGQMPAEDLPVVRTYTALQPDVEAGTLAIDFVVHGDPDTPGSGVAGPWAQNARPGDTLLANGPGGGYAPDASADWHLLVGDESALPAIGAALGVLAVAAPQTPVQVVALVDEESHQIDLPVSPGTRVTWLHRARVGNAADVMVTALRSVEWGDGRVQVFAHGESEQIMKQVRPYLLTERAIPRSDASISAYWRRGESEEGFRTWKAGLVTD